MNWLGGGKCCSALSVPSPSVFLACCSPQTVCHPTHYRPYRGTRPSGHPLHRNHPSHQYRACGGHRGVAREVLLTTRCQFFLGAFPPLLAARTLARHLLLGREAYAKR